VFNDKKIFEHIVLEECQQAGHESWKKEFLWEKRA
jgi:hypothetical protein